MKKFDVVAFGEILIDFTFSGVNSEGKNLYEENTGGAPANCAGAVCKLGGTGAFIGMTGNDSFGKNIRASLNKINVDTGAMRCCSSQHTTLAFVSLNEKGERSFSFCRNPGADTQITFEDIDKTYLDNARILHIGSLSLTQEPARSTTLKVVEYVKKAGGLISYDPNWRPGLWNDKEKAIETMKSLIPLADIVKISDEELKVLYGDISLKEGAELIAKEGVKLVNITLGAKGVFYRYTDNGTVLEGIQTPPDVKVVDTTGAGDSFNGGLLYWLTRREHILNLTESELNQGIKFATAVSSLCVTKRGAIPALPAYDEVNELLMSNS